MHIEYPEVDLRKDLYLTDNDFDTLTSNPQIVDIVKKACEVGFVDLMSFHSFL